MPELQESRDSDRSAPAPVAAETAFSSSAGAVPDSGTAAVLLGRIVLALVLYGLLTDAALEAMVSTSAARWFISGTIAVYAVLTFLFWPRFNWRAKTTASYLVLLALVLLTASADRGLTDGIHLIGQPTAVVLEVGSAAAVLFSAAIAVRQPMLPRAAQGAIVAVAFYATAAFLSGIGAKGGFPTLFHGGSFWVRLPSWLQGAFVGSLVLVPAVVVYQIATGLTLCGGALRLRALQVAGLSVAILLAVAGLRTPLGLGFGLTKIRGQAGIVRLSPITFATGESDSRPVGPAKRLQQGAQAMYAFVDFEGLTGEDAVDAIWYKGANQLARQTFRMAELYGTSLPHHGHLRFILRLDQGAPPGAYFLEISINGVLGQVGILPIDPMR